ncbi:MAG: hypothetical protein AAGK70_00780 [Pseudomonadota bacterium]
MSLLAFTNGKANVDARNVPIFHFFVKFSPFLQDIFQTNCENCIMTDQVFEERLARIALCNGQPERAQQSLRRVSCKGEKVARVVTPVVFLTVALSTISFVIQFKNPEPELSGDIENVQHVATSFFGQSQGNQVKLKRASGPRWSKVSDMNKGSPRLPTSRDDVKLKFVELLQLKMKRKALSREVEQGGFGLEGRWKDTQENETKFWNSF